MDVARIRQQSLQNAQHFGAAIDQAIVEASAPIVPNEVQDAIDASVAQVQVDLAAATQGGGGGNGGRRTGDRCDTGAAFYGGNKVYLPRKEHAGACVATGAFAALTNAHYTAPPRPALKFALPGLTDLPADNRARGHLIGYAMGGSNKDTRNFVPMYQTANRAMYDHAEDHVVQSIEKGGTQFVQVRPVYGNRNSVIPTKVEFISWGTVDVRCEFDNNAAATYKCW
ncbi:DNA/RNA non-specific endonuclease [Streptomyces sp. NPDC048018]|uniref:DNA/RNA non-specific endonuclease n=1 Tax=Streptomyces sp. NPDC048018 TaxID=3365499 RepID=UPI0037240920